ncbi:MAG: hypothetical protein P8104_06205 [Gammaproteobacteria bacterium]
MSNPQFNSTGSSTDFPVFDVDALGDDIEVLADEQEGRASVEGQARRQLEDRKEAQKLRRLLADYAWDDRDI